MESRKTAEEEIEEILRASKETRLKGDLDDLAKKIETDDLELVKGE